ncbi:MAG: PD40 domain-containing protein [Methanophagales archaeon]|nr:PD40 domain-containing protein [Methanophagales archaeon]
MPEDEKRNENGLVDRLLSSGLAFGTLIMLFVAIITSVGVVAAAATDESGELLVSIKGMYPSLSPDWKKVAFKSTEEQYHSLWIVDSDGSNSKKLTERERVAGVGGWSPKGDKILYWVYNPEDETDLWIINSDGSNKIQLTELGKSGGRSIWSPDGNKIAYTGEGGIYIVNTDGSDNKFISWGKLLSWTPDSKKIIFDGGVVIDVESGVQEVHIPRNIPSNITFREEAVSPDTSKIIYRSEYGGIWVANIDESDLKQLTFYGCALPQWSPDSERIAFISREKGIREGLWIMNSDGSNQRKIVELSDEDIRCLMSFDGLTRELKRLTWNNDGSKIAYAIYDRKNKTTDIYTISVGKPSIIKPPAGEAPMEKQPGIPGFEAVFTIAGLLAVGYILRRKK